MLSERYGSITLLLRDRRGGVYYETAWQTALSAPSKISELIPNSLKDPE